jgi:hypothetical protein
MNTPAQLLLVQKTRQGLHEPGHQLGPVHGCMVAWSKPPSIIRFGTHRGDAVPDGHADLAGVDQRYGGFRALLEPVRLRDQEADGWSRSRPRSDA